MNRNNFWMDKLKNLLIAYSIGFLLLGFIWLVHLVTHGGEAYPINDSLDSLEEALDEDTFVRLNRQYLVRISSISHLKQYFAGKMVAYLDPKASDKVVISQKKAAMLKERLNR